MGSYPLLSQAPTPVEVELGCDNEMQADIAEGALLTGGTAWDIGGKGTAKNRKSEVKGRRPKKRKLEKLIGWGEGDDDMEDMAETMET